MLKPSDMVVWETPDAAWIWIAKGIGAVAGSAVSIAYLLPKGRREAGLRFLVGVIAGLVLGTPAGVKIAHELGIESQLGLFEISMTGAAIASLCSWWGLGLLTRLADRTLTSSKADK